MDLSNTNNMVALGFVSVGILDILIATFVLPRILARQVNNPGFDPRMFIIVLYFVSAVALGAGIFFYLAKPL